MLCRSDVYKLIASHFNNLHVTSFKILYTTFRSARFPFLFFLDVAYCCCSDGPCSCILFYNITKVTRVVEIFSQSHRPQILIRIYPTDLNETWQWRLSLKFTVMLILNRVLPKVPIQICHVSENKNLIPLKTLYTSMMSNINLIRFYNLWYVFRHGEYLALSSSFL